MLITTDPYPDRITTVDLYILNANNPTETLSCLWSKVGRGPFGEGPRAGVELANKVPAGIAVPDIAF